MMTKKMLCRFMSLLLAFVLILNAGEAFTVRSSAAEEKTTKEYFAYRVDVMDAKKGNSDSVTLQVLSSIDGAVYVYVKHSGDTKPSTKDIMGSGYKTLVTAGEETDAYGHIYWLDEIEVGKKYDIYIVFEDAVHNTYGPFNVKKWVAKYFPAGNGTKKKPYQIWTARHLFNMTEYTGEDYKGKYFKVMQDIDLYESIYSGRIAGYASTFYGIFDGNGKTIRGLKGNLFDNLESTAVVKNLYLADTDSSLGSGGGIAGVISEVNKGIIEKCVVYNSLAANSLSLGIFTGENREYGIIRNCAAVDCTLRAYDNCGAMAGRNDGTIKDCYAKINVITDTTVGGIAGRHDGGTISGCLADLTVTKRKPDNHPDIGGIVGYMNSSSAYIKDCVSLYVPEDPEKLGDIGSIWGTYTSSEHLENTEGNIGALKYTLDDIKLTEKEINGSTNEEYLARLLKEKQERWVSHHGASADTIKEVKNPVKKLIAGGSPDGNPDRGNKTVISNLDIKYTHIFENETKAYNAKKKFPMTQKELKVREFSTPGRAKIKKVKVDSKNEQVTITWDPVKKAEGYEVYIARWRYSEVGGRYGEYELEKDTQSANATEYLDKYLYKNTTYFYKVRAYYKVNGVKVYGPFSEVEEVIIVKD